MTAGGTDAALLQRIEAYFDAAPRVAADVEEVGPFTLFISRIPWRFYARPSLPGTQGLAPVPPQPGTQGLAPVPSQPGTGGLALAPSRAGTGGLTPAHVRAVRARQRELRVREAFEWVAETTPSLREVAAAAGLEVQCVPLLAAPAAALRPAPSAAGDVRVRMLGADDRTLAASQDVVDVAFGGVGGAGADVGFLRERIRRGVTGVAVAEDGEGTLLGSGSHHPVAGVSELTGIGVLPGARRRGVGAALTALLADDARRSGASLLLLSAADEAVARLYERVGFRRAGTACFGRGRGAAPSGSSPASDGTA